MSDTKKLRKNSDEEYKQLGLDIKEPFSNKFYKVKGKIDKTTTKLEILKFLKDPLVWAVVVIGAILIAQQVYLIHKNLDSLPTYLPIYKYHMAMQNKLTNKTYIYIYPAISTCAMLLSLILTPRCYNRERSLVKLLMITTLLCIISQSIILIELIA